MSCATRSRRIFLTTRQKNIINILAQQRTEPVTIGEISERLNISTRTVYRELSTVQKWVQNQDCRLVRKPGVGLMLQVDRERAEKLSELLEHENAIPVYTRSERRHLMLDALFAAKQPVKPAELTEQYCISEGTLYEDIRVLNKWLEEQEITIQRRRGIGLCLETLRRPDSTESGAHA